MWKSAAVGAGCRILGLESPGLVRLVGRRRWEEGLAGVGIGVVEGIVLRGWRAETCFGGLMVAGVVGGVSRVGTGVFRHSVCKPGIAGVEVVMRLAVVD